MLKSMPMSPSHALILPIRAITIHPLNREIPPSISTGVIFW